MLDEYFRTSKRILKKNTKYLSTKGAVNNELARDARNFNKNLKGSIYYSKCSNKPNKPHKSKSKSPKPFIVLKSTKALTIPKEVRLHTGKRCDEYYPRKISATRSQLERTQP